MGHFISNLRDQFREEEKYRFVEEGLLFKELQYLKHNGFK